MSFDLALITKTVFDRIYLDAEGASVRAKLGPGLVSQDATVAILHAGQLRNLAAIDDGLPPPPFLAFRRGPMPTSDRVLKLPFFTWYIFDYPHEQYWRINGMCSLIEQAYAARLLSRSSGGVIGAVSVDAGPEYEDPSLGGLFATWARVYLTAG